MYLGVCLIRQFVLVCWVVVQSLFLIRFSVNCSVGCVLGWSLAVVLSTLSRPAGWSAYIDHIVVNLMRTFVCVSHSNVILGCVFVCGLRIYCLMYQVVH